MSKGYIEWSSVEKREEKPSNGSGSDDIWVKFAPGKFRFRLLGEPFFYDQCFISKKDTGDGKVIPVISPGSDHNPLVPLGFKESERAAMNVLHRDDGSKLKAIRVGPTVFDHIVNYAHETGINPAHPKDGIDILVVVEDPNGDPFKRKYTVTPLNNTPLTKAEVKKIKEEGGLHDLKKLCASMPTEKIQELIDKYNLDVSASEDTDFEDADISAKESKNLDSDSDSDGDSDDDDDEDFAF